MTFPARPPVCLYPRGRGALGRTADTVVNVELVPDMNACRMRVCEKVAQSRPTLFQPQGLQPIGLLHP